MCKYKTRSQSDWLLDKVQYSEWQSILQMHFENSKQIEKLKVQFGNDKSVSKVLITYSKAKKILKIEDSLDKFQFELLRTKIKEALIDNQTETIAHKVAFSRQPVDGFYRYRDLFQIAPMPEGNPKPLYRTPADLPFILQFKYVKSVNVMITYEREVRTYTKYINLLSYFLKGQIVTRKQEYSSWGFNIADEKGKICLFQHHYSMTNTASLSDEFLAIEKALKNEPIEKYYQHIVGTMGESLTLPDNLTYYLDAALSLKGEPASQFISAMRSINIADAIENQSKSASYLMLIGAIELLMPNDSTTCPKCTQPVYQVTQRFVKFVKIYANWNEEIESVLKTLYATRSDMTHRGLLFELDLYYSSMFSWDVVASNREYNWNIIRKTAFVVTLNWMLEQYNRQSSN